MIYIRRISVLALSLIVGFVISLSVYQEEFYPLKETVEQVKCKLDTTKQKFKALVNCPKEILPAAKIAFKGFPDLAQADIKFKFKPLTTVNATMLAQPQMDNNILNKIKRKYIIYVNNNKGRLKGLDFSKMSRDIQVGWIAHELGHIVDYSKRGAMSMAGMGWNYVSSPKFKHKVEQAADIIAINRGFGMELKKGVEYLLSHPEVSLKYKLKIKEHYLSVADIENYHESYLRNCH